MSDNEGQQRREVFRQDEVLSMQEELLTTEQFNAEMNKTGLVSQQADLVQDLMSHETEPGHYGTTLSPEISGALESLEVKLNYLIAMQMGNEEEAEYGQRFVSLSVGGIGFITAEKCKVEDWLKIKLQLPLFPPLKLELLGKVVSAVSVRGKPGQTRVGLSFLYRCEQEEDGVMKYLFKRQREKIRAKYAREKISE